MNIGRHRREIVRPRLNRNRLVPPLDQMPPLAMARIEPLGIGTLQPLHARHQVRLRRFQQQVVMLAMSGNRVVSTTSIFRINMQNIGALQPIGVHNPANLSRFCRTWVNVREREKPAVHNPVFAKIRRGLVVIGEVMVQKIHALVAVRFVWLSHHTRG